MNQKNTLIIFSDQHNARVTGCYGNKIVKGGNHKISFKDNLKGKKLVETTLVDLIAKIITR